MKTPLRAVIGILFASFLIPLCPGQTPYDLFTDAAPLANGYVRIAAWNLQHVDTTDQEERDFLPGADRDADNDIKAATFAKAIKDLGLDVLFVVENQPRKNEENRIQQIVAFLNEGLATAQWRSDESRIPYNGSLTPVSSGSFGGLQFAVIWNSARATIDPNANTLLLDLRQSDDLRAPWQVPITAGGLSMDVIVLHLKSGGADVQQDEVDALASALRTRLSQPNARHVVLCGDWNIRPDDPTQANRLRQLEIRGQGENLMRILTIENTKLTLDDWGAIGRLSNVGNRIISKVVPFTHYNPGSPDTFLDHMAISRSMSELFDHPLSVTLADGRTDLVPGIQIATPAVPESVFDRFTDHLPIVLTLRTAGGAVATAPLPRLSIVAAMPNPAEPDNQHEEVRVRNNTAAAISLVGWTIRDAVGSRWLLDATDGSVTPGGTTSVRRRGRDMGLDNQGGDTIRLFDPTGNLVDEKSYTGTIASGVLIQF